MSRFKHNVSSYKQNIDRHKRIVIEDREPQSSNFKIASVYPWVNSVSVKRARFTNMLHDSKDFAGKIYEVICTIWPKVYAKSNDIFKRGKQLEHCHIVTSNVKDPHKIK